ncbi:MAG TPA: hypothetical protein VG986_12055 [Pseudolabrys sp.]|nr:hypothetical protein [Pseudolabrys sp.]
MKRVIELKTGLFPDAETVAAALAATPGVEVVRFDVSGLAADDEEAWKRAAEAILGADLTVTL